MSTIKQDMIFTKIPFTALLKTYSRPPILTLTFGQVLQLCLYAHGNMTNVLEIHCGHYSLHVTLSIIHQFVALKMLCFALWNILTLTARLLYLVEYYIENNFVFQIKNTFWLAFDVHIIH